MYKSVGIRDSRESLHLGESMWRCNAPPPPFPLAPSADKDRHGVPGTVSWITFIFLPLTFMVSFFSMNVNTFKSNPPISWFFISSMPIMLLVLGLWFLLRQSKSRLLPAAIQQRAAFKAVSAELESHRPDLWMCQGPRENVYPADRASQLKLALVCTMTAGAIGQHVPLDAVGPVDEAGPVGTWSRLKTRLIRRWPEEIVLALPEPGSESGAPEVPPPAPAAGEKTAITSTHRMPDDDEVEANASAMVKERLDASRR